MAEDGVVRVEGVVAKVSVLLGGSVEVLEGQVVALRRLGVSSHLDVDLVIGEGLNSVRRRGGCSAVLVRN